MKAVVVSLIAALACAAPALAQSPPPAPAQTNAAPAPATPVIDDSTPLDVLVEAAVTQEDRSALIRRCAGPPPRILKSDIAKLQPMSEPAVLAEGPGVTGG